MTATGVNGQAAMVLSHAGDATSVLHSTLLTRTPTSATIAGTTATLTLPGPFFMPGDVVVTAADGHARSRGPTPSRSATAPLPLGAGGRPLHRRRSARVSLHDAASVQADMSALDKVTKELHITYAPS